MSTRLVAMKREDAFGRERRATSLSDRPLSSTGFVPAPGWRDKIERYQAAQPLVGQVVAVTPPEKPQPVAFCSAQLRKAVVQITPPSVPSTISQAPSLISVDVRRESAGYENGRNGETVQLDVIADKARPLQQDWPYEHQHARDWPAEGENGNRHR